MADYSPEEKDLKVLLSLLDVDADENHLNQLIIIIERRWKVPELIRLASHVASNFALNENNVEYLNQHSICPLLAEALKRFVNNHDIAHKITSALWNLCRPGQGNYIPENLAKQVLLTLSANKSYKNVVHTCIGCLSNLSLSSPDSFNEMINIVNLEELLIIAQMYRKDDCVMCYFGSMVANMAMSDQSAELCVNVGFVRMCIQNLARFETQNLHKYNMAAIHNLSDAPRFAEEFVQAKGLEVVDRLAGKYHEDREFYEYYLGLYEWDKIPAHCTTSLHLAVAVCEFEVLLDLFTENNISNLSINIPDLQGDTALQKAILYERGDVVELLSSMGAKCGNANPYLNTIQNSEDQGFICQKLLQGVSKRMSAKITLAKILEFCIPQFFDDMRFKIIEFISPFDLIQTCVRESPKLMRLNSQSNYACDDMTIL